jgi:molybdopterin-guanine dinucleotide biosynthesis protein A
MVTSIVLIGGKSSRLGADKALALVAGRQMVHLVLDKVMSLSDEVLLVGSAGAGEMPVGDEVRVVEDLYPGRGPLGGIYTGLVSSHSDYNLVVACDMPFLNVRLLRYLLELAPGYDAVVPVGGRVQALHAVYSQDCREVMKARIEHDQLGIASFLRSVNVRYVKRPECRELDPQLTSFLNVNYPGDLEKANAMMAKHGKKSDLHSANGL